MPLYDRKDHFYQKAKKEGYPARSAYKLLELDKRFYILKAGRKIVDLGCAPGGWLRVIEEKMIKGSAIVRSCDRTLTAKQKNERTNARTHERTEHTHLRTYAPTHNVIGIDLLPLHFTPKPGIVFIQGDFLDEANQQKIIETLGDKADWILSDMSPNLSGVKFRDLEASVELCRSAYEFARKVLKNGGGLVVKIFPGPESADFQKELKKCFKKISTFIPESTRSTSNEVYLVGERYEGKR